MLRWSGICFFSRGQPVRPSINTVLWLMSFPFWISLCLPFIHSFFYLFIHSFIHRFVHLSNSSHTYFVIYLFICLFTYSFIYLFIYLFIYICSFSLLVYSIFLDFLFILNPVLWSVVMLHFLFHSCLYLRLHRCPSLLLDQSCWIFSATFSFYW